MNVIKEGYKATITDEEGTVCDVIQLGGYNLEKPLARADIIDKIQDALPSEAFDPPGKGGNPMTPEEIDQVANKVAAKVLEEVSPSVLGVDALLLHFTEHEIEGQAVIVDEAKAKRTPCRCFSYKGRDYCFTKGARGMLMQEQTDEYCKAGKTYDVKPGIKERFESFTEAAEEAHKKVEEIPKGERLGPWLTEMEKELEKRGIEV